MTTFTINADNNITAFAHPHEADAVIGSGQTFTSPETLADLAAGWSAERLVFQARIRELESGDQ